MTQPQTITQSDYGYQIPFTLEDGNGNAVNLSGATLAFKVQSSQDPSGKPHAYRHYGNRQRERRDMPLYRS